jgi:hypothetical protein
MPAETSFDAIDCKAVSPAGACRASFAADPEGEERLMDNRLSPGANLVEGIDRVWTLISGNSTRSVNDWCEPGLQANALQREVYDGGGEKSSACWNVSDSTLHS